jgi:hypothetical protein
LAFAFGDFKSLWQNFDLVLRLVQILEISDLAMAKVKNISIANT